LPGLAALLAAGAALLAVIAWVSAIVLADFGAVFAQYLAQSVIGFHACSHDREDVGIRGACRHGNGNYTGKSWEPGLDRADEEAIPGTRTGSTVQLSGSGHAWSISLSWAVDAERWILEDPARRSPQGPPFRRPAVLGCISKDKRTGRKFTPRKSFSVLSGHVSRATDEKNSCERE
jgi:hypothetical protein